MTMKLMPPELSRVTLAIFCGHILVSPIMTWKAVI